MSLKKLSTGDVLERLGITSLRSKNITKQVFKSGIYKILSIAASFLIVPASLEFLDTERFGIWLTISTFIAWFTIFDVGLGNGLRNNLAKAMAEQWTKI